MCSPGMRKLRDVVSDPRSEAYGASRKAVMDAGPIEASDPASTQIPCWRRCTPTVARTFGTFSKPPWTYTRTTAGLSATSARLLSDPRSFLSLRCSAARQYWIAWVTSTPAIESGWKSCRIQGLRVVITSAMPSKSATSASLPRTAADRQRCRRRPGSRTRRTSTSSPAAVSHPVQEGQARCRGSRLAAWALRPRRGSAGAPRCPGGRRTGGWAAPRAARSRTTRPSCCVR